MRRAAAVGTAIAVVLLGVILLPVHPLASAEGPGPAPSPPVQNCVVCHGRPGIVETAEGTRPTLYVPPEALAGSVHSSLDCTDCHASLTSALHRDPVRDLEMAMSSCRRCHQEQWGGWSAGAHGPGGGTPGGPPGRELPSAGPRPTCVTCHRAHAISPATTREFAARTATTCSDCHTERGESYFDRNYHGKETHLGRYDVATCADCHGAHLVLPASDPRSTVNPANVLQTCRQCHADAPPNFADIEIHVGGGPLPSDPKLAAVTLYMLVILTGTFLFFGAVMVLAIGHEWGTRRRRPEAPGGAG